MTVEYGNRGDEGYSPVHPEVSGLGKWGYSIQPTQEYYNAGTFLAVSQKNFSHTEVTKDDTFN